MARAVWALVGSRPALTVELHSPKARAVTRTLLADTGAGTLRCGFELVLRDEDCRLYAVRSFQPINLRGAYDGDHRVYLVHVKIPALGLDRHLRAAGVPTPPPGLDGIACFNFLNDFTYGNFGSRDQFGIETP